MKRKISSALAASLIVGQMQGIAFGENTTNLQDIDVNKENVSQSTEAATDNGNTEKSDEVKEETSTEDKKEEVSTEESVEETTQESIKNQTTDKSTYNPTGKLELDLNFALPIKYTNKETTNISVTIKSKEQRN